MRWILAMVGIVLVVVSGCAGPMSRSTVVLNVYDSRGKPLSWAEFRAVQSNGAGEEGHNDALLDPDSLVIVEPWPLFESGGSPALEHPDHAVLLALAWPSSYGYSQLILPVPDPGTHNFNVLAAEAAVESLSTLRAEHAGMAPSPDAERATVTAARAIHAARATKDEASAAVAADRAYDAAVEASLLLLQEYGHRRAGALTRGVTLDRRPSRG